MGGGRKGDTMTVYDFLKVVANDFNCYKFFNSKGEFLGRTAVLLQALMTFSEREIKIVSLGEDNTISFYLK